jgi:hypothetical protein
VTFRLYRRGEFAKQSVDLSEEQMEWILNSLRLMQQKQQEHAQELASYEGDTTVVLPNVTDVMTPSKSLPSENCYDFPALVLHASNGTCPRYNGGVCHPKSTPQEPYESEEARDAVANYNEAIKNGIPVKAWVVPSGTTGGVR